MEERLFGFTALGALVDGDGSVFGVALSPAYGKVTLTAGGKRAAEQSRHSMVTGMRGKSPSRTCH